MVMHSSVLNSPFSLLFQTQLAQSNKRLLAKKFLKSAGQLLEIVKFNKKFSLQERAPEKKSKDQFATFQVPRRTLSSERDGLHVDISSFAF